MPTMRAKMSETLSPVEPNDRASDLERERLLLDQRKLALEESWPRKWGTVVASGTAAVVAALIGAGISVAQLWANSAAAEQAAEARGAEAAIAEAHRNTEDDRAALEMYFKYVSTKATDAPGRLDELKAVASVAHDRRIVDALSPSIVSLVAERPKDQKPSDALTGAPDLTPATARQGYRPANFVAYVQYYTPRAEASQKVADALSSAGLRVPGQQSIDAGHSPNENQIRIYRADQRPFAQAIADRLKAATGLAFSVRGPIGGNLPNGVIEVWLGKNG